MIARRLSPFAVRLIVVSAVVIAAVVGALLIEIALTVRPDRPFGHTSLGRNTGWASVVVLALVFGYSVAKRLRRKPGWPRGWFRLHMIAGVTLLILALIHSGAHFHAAVPVLTLIALGIVVLSGVAGQLVHAVILKELRERRRVLLHEALSPEALEAALHDEASREETFRVWQYLHAPITVTFLVLLVWHIVGAVYFGGF